MVLEHRELARVLHLVVRPVLLLQEVVDLRGGELVGVAAVDPDDHGIARLHPGRPVPQEMTGEDLLRHGHRPRAGVRTRQLHLAGREGLGEREEPAVLDHEPGDGVPPFTKLLERDPLAALQALPPRQKPPGAERIRFGEWTLDTGQRELIGPDGMALPLSSGEFRLLTALLERPKIALTRNQLLDLTKGRDADLFDRSIDNHVSRLRKKIEPDPKNPRYIKTVWGGGYIFAMDPEMA